MPIDLQEAKNDIGRWVDGFLSLPSMHLNGLSPCPYARSAMERNLVDFRSGTWDVRYDIMMVGADWDDTNDAVILIYPCTIDKVWFQDAVEYGNHHILHRRGLIALEDHPLIPETIAGLCFNQGTYALVIIQRADKLREASDILKAKGYYTNWSEDQIQDVVGWRW